MSNDDFISGFASGIILGLLLMFAAWMLGADIAESCKVEDGYLTYKNTVYSVIEYDTLDNPILEKVK